MISPFDVFLEPGALAINQARQEHLARLGLDLTGKYVLEVGAGIGLHTAFFEERGCDVFSTDGNPINVAEMMRRYPARKLGMLNLDRAVGIDDLGSFDIVYCYGTLYHLRDAEGALARLASVCRGQILLETMVALGDQPELHHVAEPLTANQALFGVGSLPTRAWVMAALARHFGHAYTTLDQPDFSDFETDWKLTRSGGNHRAIFVGSKVPLALPALTDTLPHRHRNAPPPFERTSIPTRVWIDIGAYLGEQGRQAALTDPSLTVHAFEPVPSLYAELSRGPSNYVAHPMAVTAHDGLAVLRLNSFVAASSLLPLDETQRATWIDGHLLKEERQITVPAIRLDTFMTEAKIGEVDYLKIDAQGSDLDIVRSAGRRIRDIRKITLKVAITKEQLYRGAPDKAAVLDYLTSQDFKLADTKQQSHAQEESLTFVRPG